MVQDWSEYRSMKKAQIKKWDFPISEASEIHGDVYELREKLKHLKPQIASHTHNDNSDAAIDRAVDALNELLEWCIGIEDGVKDTYD